MTNSQIKKLRFPKTICKHFGHDNPPLIGLICLSDCEYFGFLLGCEYFGFLSGCVFIGGSHLPFLKLKPQSHQIASGGFIRPQSKFGHFIVFLFLNYP